MSNRTGKRRSRRLVAIVATLSLVALGGVAVLVLLPSRDAGQYMADAQVYVEKGDLSAALIQLRNAVKREPGNPAARYQLATVALRAGDPVSAEKEIKVAQERGLSEDRVLPILAAAYVEQGKHDVLIKTIPEASRSSETESAIRNLRGMSYLAMRDITSAEASFQSALALDPRQIRAEVGLARVDAVRQDYEAADARLEQIIARQPAHDILIETLLLKGQVRRLNKDYGGAILAYSKLIDMAPTMLRARLERAEVYLEQKMDDHAAGDVGYVLQRNATHPQAVHYQALIFLRKNDEDAAFERLQRQGAMLERFAPSLLLMGQLQIKRNQIESAQTNLTAYLRAVPGNTDARLLLGNLLLQKNLPEQAISVLKAMPATADGGDRRVFRLLASASMRAGRESEAVAWLDKAAMASNAPVESARLPVERLSLSQTDTTIKGLDSAVELDAKSPDSRVLQALTLLRQGRLDDAERAAKSLQADIPDSPIPDNLLGGINMARGDRPGARSNFDSALRKKKDFIPARLNIARLDVADGQFENAARQYMTILEQNPKNTDVMIALAELSLRRQLPADSEAWLTKAVAVDATAVVPRVALINFYLSQKDYGKAMTAAIDLRQVAPSNSDALDALGRVQMARGEVANAVETYRILVAEAPLSPVAHERLAQALVAAGDLAAAKTALRIGMVDNPDASNLASELINLLQRTGEADAALKVAQDWQRRHPSLAAGDVILGNILAQQGKFNDASLSYASALKKEPSTLTMISLSRALMAAGNGDDAAKELQQWTKDYPRDVTARDALISILITQKRYDLASQESEELLKLQPSSPIVLNNLAWLYSQRKDARALEYAERAYVLAPRSPSIMDTLGYILVSNGQMERGISLLREAYESSQKMPEIGYHLAVGLAKTGQTAEAKALLETVLADLRSFDDKDEARKLLDAISR